MNANGMIDTAADYAFVDFESGDASTFPPLPLPTDHIDGHPMPLRDADAQYDVLKAEDVAFLVECVRDKSGAFKGLTFDGYNDYKPSTDPGVVALTARIKGRQMQDIRGYLTRQLQRGVPSLTGNGFLSKPFEEIQELDHFDTRYPDSRTYLPQIDSEFGGRWSATSQEADFASGAPVLRPPVRAMFDDAKNLVRPVYVTPFGGAFVDETKHMQWTVLEGTPPSHVMPFFGYECRDRDSSQWAARGDFLPTTVARVPRRFLASATVWLLYGAADWLETRSDSGRAVLESHVGFIRLSDYLHQSVSDQDEFVWIMTPTGGLALLNRIVSDAGWRFYSTSEAYYQQLTPLWNSVLLIEGVPNGRTKWWSD